MRSATLGRASRASGWLVDAGRADDHRRLMCTGTRTLLLAQHLIAEILYDVGHLPWSSHMSCVALCMEH